MRLVFADLSAHRLCADVARATVYWGAGWTAVSVCLSLLLESVDVGDVRQWTAIDVRVTDGLLRIRHHEAVVTVVPLTDDGTVLTFDQEDAVEDLDRTRSARIVDVACNGKHAVSRRTR